MHRNSKFTRGDRGGGSRGQGRRGSGGRGNERSGHSGGNERAGDGPRPPPGLRGKAIGLWYRDNAVKFRTVNKRKEILDLPKIELTPGRRVKIGGLLQQLEESSTTSTTALHTASQNSGFLQRYKQNIFDNAAAEQKGQLDEDLKPNFKFLERLPALDLELQEELNNKQNSHKYQNMLKFRELLPAFRSQNEFLKLILQHQVIVISGETGCGKTTQCCQLILDEMIKAGDGSLCNIVCTQPRRISAVTVAERVADERDEKIGRRSVGYSIRLESKLPTLERGAILFCTTGVIFQHLKEDPRLSRFSHIVVDEIHERDVLSDFLLAVLKDLIRIRPSLKVILMSATINADHFSRYFDNCPCFNIPGFTYPVEEFFLEDVLTKTRFRIEPNNHKGRGYSGWKSNEDKEFTKLLQVHIRKLERDREYPKFVLDTLAVIESQPLNLNLVEALLRHICDTDKENGAVLIFVPGWDQISKLNTQLQSGGFSASKFQIVPLHSLMPTVNQREVFNRPTGGRRKIIISTNIAETSITIDDIVYVIDTGKLKITNYDLTRNLQTLDTEWVSLANATQRKGRAGRVQKGICFHLFSKARQMSLESFKKPEVLRKRLEEVVLQIKMLKLGTAGRFLSGLLDPPSTKAVDLAVQRLIQLQALDDDENLTPLGFHLAHLPMDPQTGKMILMAGIFGCVDPILSVAASLSFKDAFYTPLGQEKRVDRVKKELASGTKSDHMVNVYAMESYEQACRERRERDFCYQHFLSANTMNLLSNMKEQFAKHLYDMKFTSEANSKDPSNNVNSTNIGLVMAIICAGLYPNVAKIHVKKRKDGTNTFPQVRTPEDGKVEFHPKSVNSNEREFTSPYVVYFEKMKSTSLYLYDTSAVSPFPLIFFGGKLSFRKEKNIGVVSIDHNVEFLIENHIFEIIQDLRKHLDRLLEEKIMNPRPTCWSELSKEGALLRAIIELITAEYREMLGESAMDSSESEDD